MVKRAVALSYVTDQPAPFVVAKEQGHLAEQMESIAREYGIEIVDDESLVDSLFFLETGDYIPESLFETVATILAYVYRTRREE